MMFESLFQRFSLTLPPLTWTTKMNVRNHVTSYSVDKKLNLKTCIVIVCGIYDKHIDTTRTTWGT